MPNGKLTEFEKGGSAGPKGVDFQIGLLIVTYLNALKMKLKNWKLSSENKKAEKFDDVVLEWENGSVLLQAKFKENRKKIALEDLTSTNSKTSDFSLPKYYSCYQNMKNRFPYLKNVILCTNAELKIDDAMIKILNDKNYLSRDNILLRKNKCSLYTFNKNFVTALTIKIEEYFTSNPKSRQDVSEENIKQFLEQLQLYCNYPSGKELNEVIEKLINEVENFTTWWSKTTLMHLYRKMMDWFQQEQGICFTETHAKAVSCELRSDKYCETLEKYKVFFKTSTLTFSGKTQIFHVATNSLIDVIKVYRCLNSNKEKTALFVNPDNDMKVFRVAIEAFTLPQYVFLVIVLPTITQENEVEEVCVKLWNVLQKEYKKLVLVADSNNQLSKQILLKSSGLKVDVITETATYIDFTNETWERLKHKKNINFQGIDINLKELVETPEIDNYKLILDSDILQKLIKNEKITIGVKVSELDDYTKQFYMKRKFKIGEAVIASEEDIYDKSGKIVLISDVAGMGKSTVLTKVGSIIKSKYPHLWVLKININDCTNALRNVLKSNTETITVTELLSGENETKLSTVFEQKVFLVKRIVLLVDGIDEVSPNCTELILNSLSRYRDRDKFEKIFIATRPYVGHELKERLNVESFSLEPLGEDSQRKFFVSFWTHNLNLQLENSQKEKCVKYAEELILKINSFSTNFVAMPLHMMMLAVIFQDNASFDELSGWQGCKDFISSSESVPKLTTEFNITELYHMFIKRKKRMFLDNVNPTANTEVNSTSIQELDKCLTYHRNLALQEMFTKTTCKLFESSYQPIDSDIETSVLKMGIIQKRNRFQFIHRTFTEYFVAQSILKELLDNNPLVQFQMLFIEHILFGYQFEVIRTFLDGFLKEVVTSLPSNLFTNYMCKIKFPPKTLNKDLLHNLAREGLVSLFELVLKSLNFKVIKDKTIRETSIFRCNILKRLEFNLHQAGVNVENFKGKTPLHYAIKKNNMEMVLYLIGKGAHLGRHSDELLDIAIKYVFLDMVKFLLEQGACITENHFISCICEDESYKKIEITSYLLEVVLDKNDLIVNEPITRYVAAYLGRLDILQSFSARDVNGVIKNGEISSFAAVRANRLEILKYLYEKGVDINWKNFYGQNILHIACDKNHLDIIKFLVECNMDFNKPDNDGHMPLHLVALAGDVKNAEFFVKECKADINVQNNADQTLLHLVALKGDSNSVEFLVKECNADFTIQDDQGCTPLHFTVLLCDLSTVQFLVKECNANINTQDKNGWTALHYAASRGDLRIIHFLVHECDANINALENRGWKPLDLVPSNIRSSIINVLS